MSEALFESHLPALKLIARGKVRDIYDADTEHLLIVTSDRLSAFDVVMPDPIPGKGKVLNAVSLFWFDRLKEIIPNQLTGARLEDYLSESELRSLDGRGMLVKKLRPLPIEAVVRGYLIGSGWKEYQAQGTVCDLPLPANLQLAEKLPEAIYTPATKAAVGDHDENISYARTVELIGEERAAQVRKVSIQLYQAAYQYALQRGIIIADTKFEFGLDDNDQLVLIDEVLTPDSSRFWPADEYQVGISPPSFDKQYVRDYLESIAWNKTPPAPKLPESVIQKTAEKYNDAMQRLLAP